MNDLLYFYQLEEYKNVKFLKRVFKDLLKKKNPKKPQWTNKARVLLVMGWFLYTAVVTSLFFVLDWYLTLIIALFLWLNRYLLLILANLILKIPERYKEKKYFENSAIKVASFSNLKVVGITGGAGKTSTKEILYALLSSKTLKTPKSYQTKNEIAKVIDYELNHRYKNFIIEMGAHAKGEIKEMCNLTKPAIGILTAINEQHLERFKNIDNTISAKFELLQNLVEPSVGIVNLDNALILENLKQAKVLRLIGYSLENKSSEFCQNTVQAKNIRWEDNYTKFDVVLFNQDYTFSTPLIGKHHLSNLLAAIICAIELGEKPDDMIEKVKMLESLEHRLELKKYNNMNILDDSYSSNISGFKEALRILSGFEGKKVIATPGIYEIGPGGKEVHKMLGDMCSKVCDLIILLGKSERTDAITIGALENNYSKDKIIRLNNHQEVYKFIDKNLKEGDTVLLENDLNEQYM